MSEIIANGLVYGFICGFIAYFLGFGINKALAFFDM